MQCIRRWSETLRLSRVDLPCIMCTLYSWSTSSTACGQLLRLSAASKRHSLASTRPCLQKKKRERSDEPHGYANWRMFNCIYGLRSTKVQLRAATSTVAPHGARRGSKAVGAYEAFTTGC